MDTIQQIAHYSTIIRHYLEEHQDAETQAEAYHRLLLADERARHYQLIATGWATPNRFVDALLIHLQIKADGKVWLLENSTEMRVAEELVQRGIAREDIVLGFHPPQYRQFTGYAAA